MSYVLCYMSVSHVGVSGVQRRAQNQNETKIWLKHLKIRLFANNSQIKLNKPRNNKYNYYN